MENGNVGDSMDFYNMRKDNLWEFKHLDLQIMYLVGKDGQNPPR